jgi:hypothetical protein
LLQRGFQITHACEQLLDYRLQRAGLHHIKIIPDGTQPADADRQPAEQLPRVGHHRMNVPERWSAHDDLERIDYGQ